MSIIAKVQRRRAEQQRIRRDTAIGADLIPRASPYDDRYAGIDLAARDRDVAVLNIAWSRLRMTPDDAPAELLQTPERIAAELKDASPDEIGRWATVCQFAYANVPNIAETTEIATLNAWAIALNAFAHGRDPPTSRKAGPLRWAFT